jgi:diguanylate cyclase (GGDEF)-like protein/PAS domain S-box-containing protein
MNLANESIISATWTTDAAGICIAYDEQCAGLLAPMLYVPLLDWLAAATGSDGDPVVTELTRALLLNQPFRHELALACRDGQLRHVLVTGLPRLGADGCCDGHTGALVDITEQRHALEHALRSEAVHRLIVDNSTDLIAHCGTDGRYIHVSSSYTRIMGWRAAQMIGQPVVGFLHPDDQAHATAALGQVLQGVPMLDVVEVRKRDNHGKYVWLGTKACLVTDPNTGKALGAVLVSRDITREKEMMQRLERMAERNLALIENSPDIMMVLDPQGTILKVNNAIEPTLGFTAASLVRQAHIGDIALPNEFSTLRGALEATMRDGHAAATVACRHRDGNLVQLAWSMRRPAGSAVLYATARDVTEPYRIRLDLQKSHEQVRTLLESINDGFFSVNRNWEITYANTRAAAFVGVDRDEAIGKVVWDVAGGLAESEIAQHLRAAMASGEGATFEAFYEPVGVWVSERIYVHEDGLSVFFHDISDRVAREARLEELATRDTLTGLPNRAWINRRVDDMLDGPRVQSYTTVFFIDLNRFKEVNDSMGHATGDRLLQQVGERLQSCMRPGDVVARLGGDEFVVAASCAGREAASAIAQRLLQEMRTPFLADGLEMRIDASIGISLALPGAATTDLLFQNADTAMYKAKALGDGSYQFFEPEMNIEAKRRLQLEVALHRALDHGQFEVHYQPRVNLQDMQVVGMEALLRWNHPDFGRVAPLEFIPLAEERGHIGAIGHWVLREACHAVKRLNDSRGGNGNHGNHGNHGSYGSHDTHSNHGSYGSHGSALQVSVNVSARQLRSPDLIAQVAQALAESGLPAAALELELTESALIEDIEQSALVLHGLKALGVRLSIDDFGTGFSSLSYLKRFPVDVLKLDRSFVNEQPATPGNCGFVRAVIQMAHALGLSVVAEGIETPKARDALRGASCDEGQGYLFAKPMPMAELQRFLAADRQSPRPVPQKS